MEVSIYCNIQGKAFSPSLAEKRTNLPLSEKNEVGAMGTLGFFRGKPLPDGACTLSPTGRDDSPYGARLAQLIAALECQIETLRSCGAEDFVLRLVVCYDTQCNLEFSPTEMQRLAHMGIPLTVSCYLKEKDVEDAGK